MAAIIAKAAKEGSISQEEAELLRRGLQVDEPWLEWAGKIENSIVEVEPVELHIHERLSSKAMLRAAARQDINRDLFADPQHEYRQAVQFYRHDMDWSNRLILGDSLQAMASLAQREDMEGKVQMVYFDPPYGIKYNSNFQPDVGDRDVKDRNKDLTREPEMVKAYRDTWHLKIHSYLTYLRDRLHAARDLLHDTGSLFIQISDENLPLVAQVADEIFGQENKVQIITFTKKSHTQMTHSVADYILWYAKDKKIMKVNNLYRKRGAPEDSSGYNFAELDTGERKRSNLLTDDERKSVRDFVDPAYPVVSQGHSPDRIKPFTLEGRLVSCGSRQWSYPEKGMERLAAVGRLRATQGSSARGIVYWNDFNLGAPSNVWGDLHGEPKRIYVVQTSWKVVERCLLMTTDPGDLVLDPTCGSGTTAYVAEKWGRRWITMDSSRITIVLTRKRLLTSVFEYYTLKQPTRGVAAGFQYETVGKVTLGSIANNSYLDPILSKHEPILEQKLNACNDALSTVSEALRSKLKLRLKEKGRKASDGDKRKLQLPTAKDGFRHWNVPWSTDKAWPSRLIAAVNDYRQAWRRKMDEVNKCIKENASQIELLDKPLVTPHTLRVAGPFTMEASLSPEVFYHEDHSQGDDDSNAPHEHDNAINTEAYIEQMIRLLKMDGITFPNNKQQRFDHLEPTSHLSDIIHAKGRWLSNKEQASKSDGNSVAVVCGPRNSSVTALQVEQAIRAAAKQGYDDLVIVGFNFDGAAQIAIADSGNPNVRVHMAHIRPDINPGMEGLLRAQSKSQLFTIFGAPRVTVSGPDSDKLYTVEVEGVDIYDPVEDKVLSSNKDKIFAWFLDGDYDGRTFCPTQVFFPWQKAWVDIAKEVKGFVDIEALEKLEGTKSFPFPEGSNHTVAVKVIDFRGNEVMSIHKLKGE